MFSNVIFSAYPILNGHYIINRILHSEVSFHMKLAKDHKCKMFYLHNDVLMNLLFFFYLIAGILPVLCHGVAYGKKTRIYF